MDAGGPSYAGVLTDGHIRAAARLALRAAGVRPVDGELADAVRRERLLAQRLVREVLPERLPMVAEALEVQRAIGRPALTERLPGMLALGWRQVHVLRSPDVPSSTRPRLGLLGATFNAAISAYDHLLDEPVRERPTPSGATETLASLVDGVLRDPTATSRRPGRGVEDADWSLLMALIEGWARTAAAVVADGDPSPWPALADTVRGLLRAETLVATGHQGPADSAGLRRWVSTGPAQALRLMAELDPAAGAPVSDSTAAAHLGEVMWLADDLADLANDARRGEPNTLLVGRTGELTDCDLYRLLASGGRRLADCLTRPVPAELNRFAHEIAFRWLQWDQHPRASTESVGSTEQEGIDAAVAATNLLLQRQAGRYAGEEHVLTFPRHTLNGVRVQTHGGLVFLRATVLAALLEADAAGIAVPDAVLAAEGLELLQSKHPGARGGWSYLPDVPELPPDADDLAQVLRALHRLGGSTLASSCTEGVRLALDASGPSTEVPTWVLPPRPQNDLDRRMRRCVELVGGGGSQPDVVANLLLALAETDPERYREPIAAGARLLAGQQVDEGCWPSAWYAGRYHGTALTISLLRRVGGHERHLRRARAFLLDGQDASGGWHDAGGEALPTAQALLALSRLAYPADASARRNAVQRLHELQQDDGGWAAEPWIQFPTRDGPHTYRSRTATTAVALTALLAANRIEVGTGAEVL